MYFFSWKYNKISLTRRQPVSATTRKWTCGRRFPVCYKIVIDLAWLYIMERYMTYWAYISSYILPSICGEWVNLDIADMLWYPVANVRRTFLHKRLMLIQIHILWYQRWLGSYVGIGLMLDITGYPGYQNHHSSRIFGNILVWSIPRVDEWSGEGVWR